MKYSTLVFFLIFVSSCSFNNKQVPEPSDRVVEFLKWYKTNINTVGRINMVNNNGNALVDSTKLYSVNFDSTEKYLSLLKRSGFISDKYMNKWRKHFTQADKDYKSNPQFDGPPEAFDFDLIMCSQEYDDDLKNIDKARVVDEVTNSVNSVLTFEFPSKMQLEYTLSNNKGKWEIDDIQNVTRQEITTK